MLDIAGKAAPLTNPQITHTKKNECLDLKQWRTEIIGNLATDLAGPLNPTSVLPQIRFDMHMPATHGSILLHDWELKAVYLCSSRSAEAATAALVVDLVAGRQTTAPYFLVSPERTSFTHFARPESPSAS